MNITGELEVQQITTPVTFARQGLAYLRTKWLTCVAAGFLPLPALLTLDPAINADVAWLYLGLASGWLVTEILNSDGLENLRQNWTAKMMALCVGIAINAALFIFLGLAVGVQSNLNFPFIAVLSTLPAIGLVPWLFVRIKQPYAAIIVAALVVFAAKLVGCVAARFAYGPDYIAQGYVAADWRTAKMMLTIFWSLTTVLSLAAFAGGFRHSNAPAKP